MANGIESISNSYNLDGNTTSFTYDGTGRLSNERITKGSAVINMAYAYDNAGNRSSITVIGTEKYVTTYCK